MKQHPILEKAYQLVMRKKGYLAIAAISAVLLVLFTAQVKALLILAVLGTASTFITLYKRVVRLPPALELTTLTGVIITLLYGPVVAIIYIFIVTFTAEVASGYPDVMTLTYIPSRIVMVLFAYIFRSMDIVSLGIWSVVVFNAVQQPIFMWLTDAEKRLKAIYFVMLNIPLNILIFKVFGHPLLSLLQAIVR